MALAYRYAFSGVTGWDPYYIYAESLEAAEESLRLEFGDDYFDENIKFVRRDRF